MCSLMRILAPTEAGLLWKTARKPITPAKSCASFCHPSTDKRTGVVFPPACDQSCRSCLESGRKEGRVGGCGGGSLWVVVCVACYVLYVVCCVSRVVCYVLSVVCGVLRIVCYVVYLVCDVLCVMYCIWFVVNRVLFAIFCM